MPTPGLVGSLNTGAFGTQFSWVMGMGAGDMVNNRQAGRQAGYGTIPAHYACAALQGFGNMPPMHGLGVEHTAGMQADGLMGGSFSTGGTAPVHVVPMIQPRWVSVLNATSSWCTGSLRVLRSPPVATKLSDCFSC